MTDEIFGPILPIVPFERIDLCLEYIRKRPTHWRSITLPRAGNGLATW